MSEHPINQFTIYQSLAYLRNPEGVAQGCLMAIERLIDEVRNDELGWHSFLSRVEVIARENKAAFELASLHDSSNAD
nr:hypothetical protein [uncultured Roseateles sp.]